MSSTTPLCDQDIRQLGQTPGGKRQVVLDWFELGDLLSVVP
jgi:hypothetical protein